jgi:hypothetical protein
VSDDHWTRWHASYEDPTSSLSRRLVVVQRRIRQALADAPPGPIPVISMCAGKGRDLLDVLPEHPRRLDVVARLVELDPTLAETARITADAAGLDRVDVVTGDASTTSAYDGVVPARLILVCGVFGNVKDDEVHLTVRELPHLCAPDATVIWTRHRLEPDLTPAIRGWFDEAGFAEVGFDTEEGRAFGVGTNRLVTPPLPFRPDRRMFTFVGLGGGAHR